MLNRGLGSIVAAAGLAAAVTVAVAVAAPTAASPKAASADIVLDWYRYAGQEVNQAAQLRGQPQRARPEMAMVQGAVYDAVNAITGTNQPYLAAPPAQRWYSQDAAAATAAYRVVLALLPDRRPALAPRYEQSLAEISDGAAKTGGVRVGEQAAAAMLAARENDGRDGPRQPVIGMEPGEWRPTPPAFAIAPMAWIGDVEPIGAAGAQPLGTAGPGLVATSGGPFHGFVIGGTTPAAFAADWLTTAWDQNAALYAPAPAAAVVEDVVGDWLTQLLGLPRHVTVGFVTGGRWPTSPPSPPPATTSSAALAGTWRRTG
jgi:hypothetical protein